MKMKSPNAFGFSAPALAGGLAALVLALPLWAAAGFAPFPFTEGFENGINTNYWTLQGTWGPTWEARHTGVSCLTDSPFGLDATSMDRSAILGVDLRAGAVRPVLTFWHLYAFEPNYDFGFVEVSGDLGVSWSRVFAVTGVGPANWTQVRIDLAAFTGQLVLIRFRSVTNPSTPYDGWYLDDLQVSDVNPVALSFPFLDKLDTVAGATNWLPSAWQQVPGSDSSGAGMSWRFVLGNQFGPGGDLFSPLTLANRLDLSQAVNPKLWFWWRAGQTPRDDMAYAQISVDGGKTWGTIWNWWPDWWSSAAWNQVQVDLTGYIGYTNVSLRFALYLRSDRPWQADFQVDDVWVVDSPPAVMASVAAGPDPEHSATVSWQASTWPAFGSYAIYRSLSSGVGVNNQLVATVTNRSTTSVLDTNLPWCGQTYYWSVFVWDTNAHQSVSSGDVALRTSYGPLLTNYPFAESFEGGIGDWALDQPWAVTTEMSHGGTHCLASNPGTNYANNADTSAYLRLDLTGANRPMLSFWQQYGFEPNQDYGFVEISADLGANWSRLYAVTGQSGTNWTKARLALDGFVGRQVVIRFRLRSDSGGAYQGWYIDDAQVNDFGTVALSFPFIDNMDTAAGATNWLPSAWQQVQGSDTNSAGMSWRFLLGNQYNPGGDLYSIMTMAGGVDLSRAINPKLWFWWRAGQTPRDDMFYAQVSVDAGKSWGTVWSWWPDWWSSAGWNQVQVDLNGYIGYTNVSLRFLPTMRSDRPWQNDFQVDDVKIAELPLTPPAVAAAVGAGPDPEHSATVSWQASSWPAFGSYAIYRSSSSGVGVTSQWVATVTNRNTTSILDAGLAWAGQTYYWSVFVWDTNGLHSASSGDVSLRTAYGPLLTNYPFAENFEGGIGSWALDQPWALTTQMSHRGTYCLASNPGTNYANSVDSSAYLALDLTAANRPMLSFWQQYGFEPNQDYGFVEISANQGASWSRLYGVTGQSGTNWIPARLALDGYAGQEVVIRFRVRSDSAGAYEGWYLDDVQVNDLGTAPLSFPFYDSMDSASSATNWLPSAWQQVQGSDTNSAGMSWRFLLGNQYNPGGDLYCIMTMAGGVDLSHAINPKLSFWWRAGQTPRDDMFYAQVSVDSGKSWGTVWSWWPDWWSSAGWNQIQVDLNGYIGYTNVSLRFLPAMRSDRPWQSDFQVDEVRIADLPLTPPVVTATAVAGPDPLHSATVSWSASTWPAFGAYAIYRSLSTGVSVTSQLVATVTNRNTTSVLDAGLAWAGQTYYWAVFVWDTNGINSASSGDVSYRTAYAPLATNYPYAESFEGGAGNWALDQPWAVTTEMSHRGRYCLASNPGANYANNADTSAYLRLDLTAATQPLLSFWQQYGFEPNQDFGLVEVSANQGASWSRLYAVTGQSGAVWTQVQVPLDGYAGQEVVIRFRLRSDGQNASEGWYLEDVQIGEMSNPTLGYTFYDNFDTAGAGSNWVSSAWQLVPGSATTSGGKSWRLLLGNQSSPGGDLFPPLRLAGGVDLSKAVNPKLWFSWRAGQTPRDDTFYAQVSVDGGKSWGTVWSWWPDWWSSASWNQVQVDLSGYVGYTNLAVRFAPYMRSDRPWQSDFQVDEVLIAEGGGVPAILTANPLPSATAGYAYNLILQATHGATPYTWAVVSNSLPPGLALDSGSGTISGTPTNLGVFNCWLAVTTSNNISSQRPFSLTVQEYLPVFPTHTIQAFVSPGTNVVYCQVDNQSGRPFLSLVWVPTLPAGWSLVGAQGDGGPEVGPDGHILFQAQYLTNNPLRFSYQVAAPAGVTQAQQIGGAVTFLLDAGMVNERTLAAQPSPLLTLPRTFQSADCNTNWVIETEEASRVLAYWRAQAYHLDPSSCDGYAPGPGAQLGPLNSADYRAPFWLIDGTEINRVLACWRAGCYQRDNTAPDGFAPGCGGSSGQAGGQAVQHLPLGYEAGTTLLVTNLLTYTGTNLSLLWRPVLPAGWTINTVLADGAPEVVNGELVWTAPSLPPSPVQVVLVLQVPLGDRGAKQIRSQIEFQQLGSADPVSVNAAPDPAVIYPTYLKFTGLTKLPDGTVQLGITGTVDAPVRLQSASRLAPSTWTTLTTLPALTGPAQFTDTNAPGMATRFYRLLSP